MFRKHIYKLFFPLSSKHLLLVITASNSEAAFLKLFDIFNNSKLSFSLHLEHISLQMKFFVTIPCNWHMIVSHHEIVL